MDIAAWLARATEDADARGLPELTPLLETLARSTQALRDADAEFRHPAADHGARHTQTPQTNDVDDEKPAG